MKKFYTKTLLLFVLSLLTAGNCWADEFTFLGTGTVWNCGENVYSYIGSEATMKVGATMTINLSNETSSPYFDAYVGGTNTVKRWYQSGTGQLTYTTKLTEDDITALSSNNYTITLVVWSGKCSIMTITNGSSGSETSGDDSGSGDSGSSSTVTKDYTYQNDTNEDGTLEPTSAKPAFGCYVDYSTYPQLTNIPTMYLTCDAGETLDYTNKTEDYYSATIVIVDKNGKMKQRNEAVTFRGRGNSSWNCGSAKKPWRLKFPSKTKLLAEYDLTTNTEVNNYADNKSWTLLANYFDKSLIRNAATYELGKMIGMPFCPAYRFVDLVLNGEYYGTYQVSDHMNVDSKRININSDTGWFVEQCTADKFAEAPNFWTNAAGTGGYNINIKNPETTQDADTYFTESGDYYALKKFVSNAINSVASTTDLTTDASTDWTSYIDMNSLADWLIGMEVTGNYDGMLANDYAYTDATNPKLKFGPLWDLDLAYGNYGSTEETHFWTAQGQGFGYFYPVIYQKEEFQKVFYPKWKKLYEAGLATKLNAKIDEIYNNVKESAIKNFTEGGHASDQYNKEYWTMGGAYMGKSYTTNRDVETVTTQYAKAVDDVKTYITNHIAWMNTTYIDDYESITGLKADDAVTCSHTYNNNNYVSNGDGTYSIGCDICGEVPSESAKYYKYTVYPESADLYTEYNTSKTWQPSDISNKPNTLIYVDDASGITGTNIVNADKATCSNLTITDGHPFYNPSKFTATTATYTRNVTEDYGTICLPYKVQNINSETASFYALSSVSENNMVFSQTEADNTTIGTGAYIPLLFKRKSSSVTSISVVSTDVTVKKSSTDKSSDTVNGCTMYGTVEESLIKQAGTDLTSGYVYQLKDNKFSLVTTASAYTNSPFRAYIISTANTPSPYNISLITSAAIEGDANGDGSVTIEDVTYLIDQALKNKATTTDIQKEVNILLKR